MRFVRKQDELFDDVLALLLGYVARFLAVAYGPVLGGLLTSRWPRMAWVHIPVVLWGAGIEFVGGICPLTPLENHWRRLAGEQGYSGGFVDHYVIAFLYPDGLTRTDQIAVGLLVLALNIAIYAWALRRRRARRRVGTRLVP